MQYNAVQCSAVQCSTVQKDTTHRRGELQESAKKRKEEESEEEGKESLEHYLYSEKDFPPCGQCVIDPSEQYGQNAILTGHSHLNRIKLKAGNINAETGNINILCRS